MTLQIGLRIAYVIPTDNILMLLLHSKDLKSSLIDGF